MADISHAGVAAGGRDPKQPVPPGRRFAHISCPFLRWLGTAVLLLWIGLRWSTRALVIVLIAIVVIFAAQTLVFTPRDVAYRYAAPQPVANPAKGTPCGDQRDAKTALADPAVDNDELAAIRKKKIGERALTCMLQEHEIPVGPEEKWRNGQAMGHTRYFLSFLEFTQDGWAAERTSSGGSMERNQLDVLIEHLRAQTQNYVIVFIHGWRHDASIGDDNVQALRIFASHAASFLDFRCKVFDRYCNATVTAVYVGWRGARVHEYQVTDWVGQELGETVGTILAAPTLFDRKPVSERVAPAVLSALRRIDRELKDRTTSEPERMQQDRMITIGHSLGGNMLAVSLKELMIDQIRRHTPETRMKAPLGDLVVLLNPASEASNWTAIQRAMRERVVFEGDMKRVQESWTFFPADQPPVYVALTAASDWPVGGVRMDDYRWLEFKETDSESQKRRRTRSRRELDNEKGDYRSRADYDWATHDLFPAFRGDLRPAAQTWARNAAMYGDQAARSAACRDRELFGFSCISLRSYVFRALAAVARNVPFMNTNSEETRTVGHFHPMRPPYGTFFVAPNPPATVYGTTHEFVVNQRPEEMKYRNAGSAHRSECEVVDGWLWTARNRPDLSASKEFWDSGYTLNNGKPGNPPNVTPVRKRDGVGNGHIESQFRHGYFRGGMRAIVTANDPFWNVRAFDTALRRHDGYVSYPLICAMHQLVMDDVAAAAKPPPSAAAPAPAAGNGRSAASEPR